MGHDQVVVETALKQPGKYEARDNNHSPGSHHSAGKSSQKKKRGRSRAMSGSSKKQFASLEAKGRELDGKIKLRQGQQYLNAIGQS